MGVKHIQTSVKSRKMREKGISPPKDWGDVNQVRAARIAESKVILDGRLACNPIVSEAHGGIGARYSVTRDKQALMTSEMLMAQGAALAGIPYELKWNSAGQPCEPWELEDLQRLALEISAYVKPLVSLQRSFEAKLNSCVKVEEIEDEAEIFISALDMAVKSARTEERGGSE